MMPPPMPIDNFFADSANFKYITIRYSTLCVSQGFIKRFILIGRKMAHKILNVEGMSCDHCVQTIQKAVKGLSGIRKVVVTLDKKEVHVDFDESKTDVEAISEKITNAGFEVVG